MINNKLKMKLKKILPCITILLFLPIQISDAIFTETLNEDFSESDIAKLTDWTFNGYEVLYDTYSEIPHGFTLDNGALKSFSSSSYSPIRRAMHNSDVAFGNWSFDWTVSTDNLTFDAIEFIFKDHSFNYDLDGHSVAYTNYSGYSLVLDSYGQGTNSPGLGVVRFDMLNPRTSLITNSVITDLSGTHHIDITRNLDGEFNIYFDSIRKISFVDNKYNVSEKFSYASFRGNSSIDNLIINRLTEDTTTTTSTTATTNGFAIEIIIPALVLIVSVLMRKDKK